MNWLKTLFKRTKQTSPIPMPPYDEIVKSLYDKELVYSDELKICKVIYNKDNSKRFVILESKKGFFKYTYEEICVFDDLHHWPFLWLRHRRRQMPKEVLEAILAGVFHHSQPCPSCSL